jgi:general secretion pathway protein N
MPRLMLPGLAALLLVILLVTAPARLILPFLPVDQLTLQGVSGSLWQGFSSRALVAVPGGHLHLGRLSWSLTPSSLLTLSPRVALDSRWGGQRIQADVVYKARDSLELYAVDAVLPAALVRQFIPLELSGSFALISPQLVIEGGVPVAVSGRVIWRDGGWMSPQGQRHLGTYAIDFQQLEGSSLLGEVETVSGELQAGGNVSLDGRNYAVDIVLSGAGLDDPQLEQALQLVAIPEGDRFRVKLQGSF